MKIHVSVVLVLFGVLLCTFVAADWMSICKNQRKQFKNDSTKELGNQLPANCSQDGSIIHCKNAEFSVFPKTFPTTAACLVIEFGRLAHLHSDDIHYLRNLNVLAIVSTPLYNVSGIFGSNQPLEKIILHNTSLESLPRVENTVKTLEVSSCHLHTLDTTSISDTSLQSLNISGNPVMSLDANMLRHLPQTLITLDISRCPVEVVASKSFSLLPNLKTFLISARTIQTEAFIGLSAVDDLFLETCHIKSYGLRGLQNVQSLDLSYACKFGENTLTLDRYAFGDMTSLLRLNLDHSGITSIPTKAFSKMPSIRVISMKYNPIRAVWQGAFDGLITLEEIFMSHSTRPIKEYSIVILGDNTFSYANLSSLRVLDLQDFRIWNITLPTFRNLPQLREVYFGGNSLHFLVDGTFAGIADLITVDVGDNPWRCDCALRWLKVMMGDTPNLFVNSREIMCAAPPNIAGRRFVDLTPDDFICPFDHIVG